MQLITKHLDKSLLTCKIENVNTICAFSGAKISEGIKFSEIIRERFTELEIFKFKSNYLSVDFALLTQPVIQGTKQLNSLRNYSFFATDKELKILNRDEILELLFNIPETPFQIAITYSNKKHLAYKTPLNYNKEKFKVCTDAGIVEFDVKKAKQIFPILQNWYTIAKQTTQQPTYFTKDEILGLSIPNNSKISEYGIEKYFAENDILKPYRNTLFLKLLVHILNKK
jgi:hypothetical protein